MARQIGKGGFGLSKMMPFKSKVINDKAKTDKPSLLRRLGAYLKVIVEDYKIVAIETGQDMKARPIKSGIILSILGSVGYLIATNPDETSYREQILTCSNDLLQLSDLIRNPSSDDHIHDLMWAYNQNRVRRFTLGVCSFMWIDNYSKDADIYEARCKHLKVGWTDFHKHIVDIGVNGRWLNLEKAMTDYDINPEEWKEMGTKDTQTSSV